MTCRTTARLPVALGALRFRVETELELADAVEAAASGGRTAVIDCRTDPIEQVLPDHLAEAAQQPT